MPVFLRALLSLAVLSGSYWLYVLFAVPLVEPPSPTDNLATPPAGLIVNERPAERYRHLLEPLFPPDSWELQNPKVLRNNETMLLLDDYRILEDGRRLQLNPCTVIYSPNGLGPEVFSDAGSTAEPPAIFVLQAEEGAILEFDQPLDFRRGDMGRVQSGRLLGKVHIYNPLAGSDAKHRLDLVTSNVQIHADRIWTPSDVDFRVGPVEGRGRDLAFHLLTENASQLRRLPSSNDMRIRAVELVHLDWLRVQLPAEWSGENPESHGTRDAVMEIKCDGAMMIDVISGLVTVEKNVVLRRPRADGEDDHLYCNLLSLHSAAPDRLSVPVSADDSSSGLGAMPAFRLDRIVALGDPAVVSLSAQSINEFRGNVAEGSANEARAESSTGLRGRHHGEAKRFEYQFSADGGVGAFRARGPGKYRSTAEQTGTGYLEVAWEDELSITPDKEFRLLSLLGKSRIHAEQLGRLSADSLLVWLRDDRQQEQPQARNPPSNGPSGIVPDRALAQGNVVVQSQQLSGNTDQLEVWFKYSAGGRATPTDSKNELGLTRADGATGVSAEDAAPAGLHVQGDLIRMLVNRNQQEIELEDVTLRGGVQCVETNVSAGEKNPVQMFGELFRLSHFTAAGGSAKIEGRPARIQARGISVVGESIEMDRGSNRLWIAGAGTATLPLPDELAVRYSRKETSATVNWSNRCDFDGRRVQCSGNVVIRGPAQSIQTEALTLTLTEPVRFGDPRARLEDIGIAEIAANGSVRLENHSFDQRGLVTIDKMLVRDLMINQITGAVTGQGPGWVHSVREGGRRLVPFGGKKSANDAEVTLLHVDFQSGIRGNLHQRELSFLGQVKAMYGSADDWPLLSNSKTRHSLPEGGVVMRCQELKVVQMSGRKASADDPIEMIATGNTTVEGKSYTARAHRISYAQAKGQLVIEGDGRTDAELWRQETAAGPMAKSAARKIQFWPETNRIKVEDAKFLDLGG